MTEREKDVLPVFGDNLKMKVDQGKDGSYVTVTDVAGGSIRIPVVSSQYGAAFGETISDIDREWAANREPIGHFLVFKMAKDALKNWFRLDDPETEDKDPDVDRKIQGRLTDLKIQPELRKALEWERLFGWSLIVGRFDDASSEADLTKELSASATLKEIVAYHKNKVTSTEKDRNQDSDRFGEVTEYRINRGSGYRRLRVHWTRVIRLSTRTGEKSILDSVYDDLSTYRNERWGLGQTLWRYGSGFPKITIPGYSVEQLTALKNSGKLANLMSRSFVLINDQMKFEFIGAQGTTLNPAPYVKPVLESIAAGSGVPEPILRGAQAGALTGSEVNERTYWGVIATIQRDLEPFIRALIDWAFQGNPKADVDESVFRKVKDLVGQAWDRVKKALNQKEAVNYEFVWLSGFEVDEETKARTDLYIEQSNRIRLDYMKVDEVRVKNELEELKDENGESIPGLLKLQKQETGFGPFDRVRDQVAFPTLAGALEALKDRVLSKDLTKNEAIAFAKRIIEDNRLQAESIALLHVQARSRKQILSLPIETQNFLKAEAQRYLDTFINILDDALGLSE